VNETAVLTLRAWETFYVIVGSTAGALTGLQFVVLTLIMEAGMLRGTGETLAAFGSPNVVHFCAALLLSAILSAPWTGIGPPGVAVTLIGIGGLIYSFAVLRRASRQKDYQPVLEDWIWHALLPILAYGVLLISGFGMMRSTAGVLFATGGAALLLVFIGIHNAWDTVTYVVLERAREHRARAAARPKHAAGTLPVTGSSELSRPPAEMPPQD
jgi:hypothetical protein